jgi:cytochrome c biogenesis protein CcdA
LDTDLAQCTVDLQKAVTAKSTVTLSTWVLLIDTAACVRRKRVDLRTSGAPLPSPSTQPSSDIQMFPSVERYSGAGLSGAVVSCTWISASGSVLMAPLVITSEGMDRLAPT